MNNILLCITVPLMLALASAAALTADFDVDWYTVDGGGEMWTTGGDYELSGTIGEFGITWNTIDAATRDGRTAKGA